MKKVASVILAAGEGTRMKSGVPKVLHLLCGKPIIEHVIDNIASIGIKDMVVVVGHKADLVKKRLKSAKCIHQKELLGTGDAVLITKDILLKDEKIDSVLIAYGDVPLLKPETLKKIIERHRSTQSGCTLLTARMKNPTGYGRILRDGNKRITRIIEELDASIYEKVYFDL